MQMVSRVDAVTHDADSLTFSLIAASQTLILRSTRPTPASAHSSFQSAAHCSNSLLAVFVMTERLTSLLAFSLGVSGKENVGFLSRVFTSSL